MQWFRCAVVEKDAAKFPSAAALKTKKVSVPQTVIPPPAVKSPSAAPMKTKKVSVPQTIIPPPAVSQPVLFGFTVKQS